ncbi:MAG: 30S ribosomal protein S8 [Minisyncoccia bacterium]|jgi:small subunit ribosomal protein S8
MTDPISDMITRIRNAQAVGKKTVIVPFSNFKWNILEVLKRYNFIGEIEKVGRGINKVIEIKLKYHRDKTPRINFIQRVSKPSRRIYLSYKELWPYRKGLGIRVISTPKGVMSDKEARKEHLGGEVILEIY